ncbi:hypothetical protein [Saccharopolyspora oryzae]|uniref:Uncharacterized protein n=1 Tax=Saccharopolyspora oryzae TaxID=2997343 RepID=A0ABT4V1R9_9PSEU|nr:hypothetical protein [Saccharopolyspora oryzae]MDA3627911.1 hypothetical protein [Saccharopolyspora oryzae]
MRYLLLGWAAVIGPLIVSGLIGGPTGLLPHLIYHLVYSALSLIGIWAAVRMSSRGRRVSLAAAVGVIIAGQLGQELVVLTHGGVHAGPEVLTQPFHVASAMVSLLGIVAAVVVLIAVTVATVVPGRRTVHDGRIADPDTPGN